MLLDLLSQPIGWIILFILYLVIMLLIQLFFCLRRSFWPGLLMPLAFLLMFLYCALDVNLLPLGEFISVTEPVQQVWMICGLAGFLISLLFYFLVRITKGLKRRTMMETKRQIIAEKQRLMAQREAQREYEKEAQGEYPRPQSRASRSGYAMENGGLGADIDEEDLQLTRQYPREKITGQSSAAAGESQAQAFKIDRRSVYAAAYHDQAAHTEESQAADPLFHPLPQERNGQNQSEDLRR